MTMLKWLLITALLGYGGLLALVYVFQRSLMYFPDRARTPPVAAGLPQVEEVTLTSADGEKLIAWHLPPQGTKRVVIYFQGNAGALDLRAGRFKWLIADGTGLLALSYRGYGGSTGKPSEVGLIRDAAAAYDFAATRYPAERIVLWGEFWAPGSPLHLPLSARSAVSSLMRRSPPQPISGLPPIRSCQCACS